jgi:hypothetical protein
MDARWLRCSVGESVCCGGSESPVGTSDEQRSKGIFWRDIKRRKEE